MWAMMPNVRRQFTPLQKEHHMATEKKCLRCGSTCLEPGLLGGPNRVCFRPKNTKFMTLQTGDVSVGASICLDCGLIVLSGDFEKATSLTGRTKPG
jgi:hypothetical protein